MLIFDLIRLYIKEITKRFVQLYLKFCYLFLKFYFKGHIREPEISPLQLCLENVHRTLQRSANA